MAALSVVTMAAIPRSTTSCEYVSSDGIWLRYGKCPSGWAAVAVSIRRHATG